MTTATKINRMTDIDRIRAVKAIVRIHTENKPAKTTEELSERLTKRIGSKVTPGNIESLVEMASELVEGEFNRRRVVRSMSGTTIAPTALAKVQGELDDLRRRVETLEFLNSNGNGKGVSE